MVALARFGPKPKADDATVAKVRALRAEGKLIREIMAETGLSKTTVYRALGRDGAVGESLEQ
jgi:hypothetical protein